MAPNNFEFDFAQISYNTFESRDGNIFQDDRDPDWNYFDETNILSKETTYINETDMKNLICETQRFENVSVLLVNTRWLKINFENFHDLWNNTGSISEIINSSYFDLIIYK